MLSALLLLVLLLLLLLQLPAVQNFTKNKFLDTLSERYNVDWQIDHVEVDFFDELTLEGIKILDQEGDTLIVAEKLWIDIGVFSLFQRVIQIDDIKLSNAIVKLYELEDNKMNYSFMMPDASQDSLDTANSSPWDYDLKSITLEESKFVYQTSEQNIQVYEKDIKLEIEELDLEKKIIRLGKVSLDGLEIAAYITPSDVPSSDFKMPSIGWTISTDELNIQKSDLKYSTDSTAITIAKLNSKIRNLNYKDDSIGVTIANIDAKINNKINLKNLSGDIQLAEDILQIPKLKVLTDRDRMSITDLYVDINDQLVKATRVDTKVSYGTLLEIEPFMPDSIYLSKNADFRLVGDAISFTPQSLKGKELELAYGEVLSVKGDLAMRLADKNGQRYVDANLVSSEINLKEVEKILPTITIPDSLRNFETLSLKGEMVGNINDLAINNLEIKIDEVFRGVLSGTLKDINNSERLFFDVAIDDLSADMAQLPIQKNDNIAIDSLGIIKYSGIVKGSLKDIKLDGDLNSDLGIAKLDVKLNIPDSIQAISYDGTVDLNRFKLGVLLKNSEFDEITISTKIKGQGIDLANLNSSVDGTISNFSYGGYKYEAVSLNAIVRDSSINGQLSIDDPNLKLAYTGIIEINESESIFDFTTDIDTINLASLGFIDNDISFSGAITSKFNFPLIPGSKGELMIEDFNMSNPSERFYADSISLLATKNNDSTFVDVRSDFMTLDIDGDYLIKDLPNALMKVLDHHLVLIDYDKVIATESKNMSISGELKTLKPLDIWMQHTLIQSKYVALNTRLNFVNNEVNGEVVMDSFFYANNKIEKLNIDINTNDPNLEIVATGENVDVDGTHVPNVILKNEFSTDAILSTFEAKDDDKLPRLKFAFETTKPDSALRISFTDSLILNQKDWLVSKGNQIDIFGNKLLVNNFELTDSNEFLTIQSTGDEGDDIDIKFKNFNIGQFTTLLTSEPSKLSGNIDGDVEIKDLFGEIYYLANLRIEDMIYDSTSVGVLSVEANDNPRTNILTTSLTLKGPSNDVVAKGTYNTQSQGLDFKYNIKSLQMKLLDPFFTEIFYDSEGVLSGKGKLAGTIDQPNLEGLVKLEEIGTTIAVNNVRYFVSDHEINFDNDSFKIGNLKISDRDNNESILTGEITHDFLDQFYLDLNMKTDEFLLLNTTAADNPVFYGKLMMDANAQIKGPPELLDISIVATTLESTDVTLSPLSAEQLLLEEDYITYGKPEDFEDITNEYLLKLSRLFPFKVDLNLDVTKDAKLSFVVDPVSGDKIDVTSTGDLLIIFNPDGQQEIYGTCTIDDGTYNFSYGDFISKKFQLKPGGTIRFNGDPLKALLDIEAIYTVYTSTYPLIRNEVALDDGGQSSARDRTNVEVYLSLDGTIENPIIGLDLKIPGQQSNSFVSSIDRKLIELRGEPNKMNTQVFNLLIFDSFLAEDNAVSGFSNIGSSIALSSISNLISNELNRLADNVIKGVDVRINVDSYDSSYANSGAGGTVTEVGLNVSKRLFNDRLSLSAGGNIDFADGLDSEQSYASLVGDFILEYKLVESGRLRLRVFSKSDYDRLLDENRNRNGISLFFNRAFDSKLKK